MLSTIIVLVLLAVVAWGVWMLYKNGWDMKKAWAAIIAAVAAAWVGLSDSFTNLFNGM